MTKYILIALLLAGCSPKIIYVPVDNCPVPPAIQIPTKPQLSVDATTKQKLKALRLYVNDVKYELERCSTILDSYR